MLGFERWRLSRLIIALNLFLEILGVEFWTLIIFFLYDNYFYYLNKYNYIVRNKFCEYLHNFYYSRGFDLDI
jgi:hypothetical protein